jgi:hypothetical protein
MVDIRALDQRFALTRSECWLLYVWLGERAPFVRNQLSVARNGGSGPVSISTHEEGRHVLAAIAACPDPETLTGGLRSLEAALSVNGRGEGK